MPFSPKPHSALLIVGHGSTENPDSSNPYFDHADAIRRLGLFHEVHCCFWKEEPSLREVPYLLESNDVYVVPDFISEGYFTQEIIPRELNLTGASTTIDGKTYHYCPPVGIHPSMTQLLLQRAADVAPNVPRDQTTLIIVGHGTSLNQNSTRSIVDQVEEIRASSAGYAHVSDAYMEQEPLIANWHEYAQTPYVVVVPFFIADGAHSYQDIPVMLGFEEEIGLAASQRDVFRHNPHHLHGKELYYSHAIGTERSISSVILDQIADFDAKHLTISPV